jgi:hypothetical protein
MFENDPLRNVLGMLQLLLPSERVENMITLIVYSEQEIFHLLLLLNNRPSTFQCDFLSLLSLEQYL